MRYQPLRADEQRVTYFLARIGIPLETVDLRTRVDDLSALMLSLAIGMLEGVQSGAIAAEGPGLSFNPNLLCWLRERVPGAVVDLLAEIGEISALVWSNNFDGKA